ncbi:MAG: hypothetical protein EBY30_05780 [Rhodospirillales bacterium]|nr:hypothetical protein [Rhodospirillales bacterium]
MRLTRRASILAALATPALAQTYPERPIRLIIPYSAGGVADTIARTIQPKMAEHLGQSLVVENRTGASGAIAAAALAQSAPDGHTFMLEGATFATLPLVSRSLPVDYETAFTPVAQVTSQPYYLAVHQNFPAEDFQGFLAAARARPGQITYGTPGHAHIGHFMGELIQLRAGIRLEHIPYRGGADAAREVGTGRIDAAIISGSSPSPAPSAGPSRRKPRQSAKFSPAMIWSPGPDFSPPPAAPPRRSPASPKHCTTRFKTPQRASASSPAATTPSSPMAPPMRRSSPETARWRATSWPMRRGCGDDESIIRSNGLV